VYQLILVQSGEMVVTVDHEPPVTAPAGDAILLLTGQRVLLQCAPARETRHSWLSVAEPQLSPDFVDLLHAAPRSQPISPALTHLMDAGLALDESVEDATLQTALAGVVSAALSLYLQEARTRGQIDQQATLTMRHPAITAVRRLVRQQLHEPLTVAALAEAAHVTPDYLTRLFRRELGTTPMRYVWAERVRLGVDLLEHTGLPVTAVALRTGFQTPNHFSRLVHAATGLSPRQVRRERWRQPAN
jgi:AraC-like DNA-binding protein